MRAAKSFSEIYLHRAPVDGRKGINGLAMMVEQALGENPFGGALFAFTSRRRDTVRLLYWDRSGFALWMKRLEEEKFKWPLKHEDEIVDLSPKELEWLLDGFDITRMKPHATLAYSSIS